MGVLEPALREQLPSLKSGGLVVDEERKEIIG